MTRFVAALLLAATAARAQSASDARSGFTLGTGLVVAPDPPSGQSCNGGIAGLEANGGAILRPRSPWVIEFDVRSAHMVDLPCAAVGVAVDTLYFMPAHAGYLNSTLRVGVETPARFPLFRFTVGGGAFLSGRASPFAVFDAAWSTRGKRARFFIEAQHTITRVDGVERHFDIGIYPPRIARTVTANAMTYALHVGMEFPTG